MKSMMFPAAFSIVAGLALAGCARREALEPAGTGRESRDPAGVTFSAKRGLSVPEETARFIGLEVADVEERGVTAAVRFGAWVFQSVPERRFASAGAATAPRALAAGFVPAAEAARLTHGQTAFVSVTNAAPLKAAVVQVNHAFEKVQGQTEIMIAIEDPAGALQSGQAISVSVPLTEKPGVLVIPRSALLRTAEGDFAYAVNGKHFIRAKIQTGEVGPDFVEVADGLYLGDCVVAQPVLALWLAELQSVRGGKSCAAD